MEGRDVFDNLPDILVRLVTRSAKARFGQVGDQVTHLKYQVGQQGQGQELDNNNRNNT